MCLRARARAFFSLRSAFSCARTCFCASIFLRARRRWVTQVSVGALCQGGCGRRLPPHPYSHRPPSCCPRGRPRGEATNIYSPSVPPQTASFLSGPGRLPPPPHHPPSVSGPPVPRGLGGRLPDRLWVTGLKVAVTTCRGAGYTAAVLRLASGREPVTLCRRGLGPPSRKLREGGGCRRARVFVS